MPTPSAKGSHRHREAGASLVIVLMALVFMGILVVALSGTFSQSLLFRRIVATGEAYRDIEESFQEVVAGIVRTQFNAANGLACASGTVAISPQALGIGGLSVATSQQIPSFPVQAPVDIKAADDRCQQAHYRALGAGNDLYFCLLFNGIGNKNVANTTLAGAAAAFAEVRARLFDLTTGAAMTCADYQQLLAGGSAGSASLEITYSIYWYTGTQVTASQLPAVFKRRNGLYYATPL